MSEADRLAHEANLARIKGTKYLRERGHMTNQTILASIVRELERQSMVTGQPVGHYGEMWRLVELQGKFDLGALAAAIERDLIPAWVPHDGPGRPPPDVCAAFVAQMIREQYPAYAARVDECVAELRLLQPLKWSSERPAVPGFYWFRINSDDPEPCVSEVRLIRDELYVNHWGSDSVFEVIEQDGAQYAGPLKPPEE